MTAAEVQARGLERISRGDFDTHDTPYEVVKLYAGWLLRQTGNQDKQTPSEAAAELGEPDA